ncbi:glycosyltransferase [Methylobacterium sp. Leaf361]|uniref:glycosyltransferase n=1 Tax=Methylobacterium sp. Leaf361 TaxID=1736352 RepID=UPI0012FED4E4|nr:glycosyltransferase [Methylobacterium sp. Leaf361]
MDDHADEVICLASRYLDANIARQDSLQQFFEFYYNEFIRVLPTSQDPVGISDTHKKRSALAAQDIARLFNDYSLTSSDILFFPSTDFYSLVGLETCKNLFQRPDSPKLLLRFIGVMESASSAFRKPIDVALMYIRSIKDAGCKVSLSAETPVYADWLAEQLDQYVSVTPYGEVRDPIPLRTGKAFHVICPGSARFDKGFLRLEEIFSKIRIRDPDIKITFSTQSLVDTEVVHHQTYITKIYAIPGVNILPSMLDNETMDELYASSDIMLLPYDTEIYKYRGSAVLMESATIGRPVVATDNVGFSEQIRYYGMGSLCKDNDEMVSNIITYSTIPREVRWRRSLQARSRFVADMRGAFKDWVG